MEIRRILFTTPIHNSGVEITTNATARAFWWRSSQYYGAVTRKQGGNDTTRRLLPYIKT
jgi:hypothetical protein